MTNTTITKKETTLTPNEVQNFIGSTLLYNTNKEMATLLQVKGATIGANFSILKMADKITSTDEIERDLVATYNKIFKREQKRYLETKFNSFSNSDGVEKSKARVIIMRAIMKGVNKGTILSLPFHTCTLEALINSQNELFDFIGCEIDSKTFIAMENKIAHTNLPIKAYEGTIGSQIENATANTFAHLMLDYCGTINTFHKEIELGMKKNIMQVGGAMCVTVSKEGRQNNIGKLGEILSQFPKGTFEGLETELATKLYFRDLVRDNPNYELETIFNYQDVKKDENGQPIMRKNNTPSKKMPMMLFIIRRVK